MAQIFSAKRNLIVVALSFCAIVPLVHADKTYSAKNQDEIDVYSAVLSAEMNTNHWAKEEKICFSVNGNDPSKKLVEALKQQQLNVCSPAEWRKKLACRFQVNLQEPVFSSPDSASVKTDVADFSDINAGEAHIAVLMRRGDYSLSKSNGKWVVKSYSPSK